MLISNSLMRFSHTGGHRYANIQSRTVKESEFRIYRSLFGSTGSSGHSIS